LAHDRNRTATVQANGVTVTGTSDRVVTHSLYVADPDDNEIELYIDVQPEVWSEDPSAVMATPPPAAPVSTPSLD
jgi:catechol-2,3-dioxygenase